jgi:hypothetical protein
MTRLTIDARGQARFLYAGPYHSEIRAEQSLEASFADGDVSLSDRPNIVYREGFYWVELDG